MKIIISLFFSVLCLFSRGQENSLVKLEILDSLVVFKCKQDVSKIRIKLTLSTTNDTNTFVFCKYSKFLPSNPFVSNEETLNMFKDSNIGLFYIIENESNEIVPATDDLQPSYKYAQDEVSSLNKTIVIDTLNLKLNYQSSYLSSDQALYHHSELLALSNPIEMNMFPVIRNFHSLSKGNYYLYLFYAYNKSHCRNEQDDYIPLKSENAIVYKGSFRSNKVRLIVE